MHTGTPTKVPATQPARRVDIGTLVPVGAAEADDVVFVVKEGSNVGVEDGDDDGEPEDELDDVGNC